MCVCAAMWIKICSLIIGWLQAILLRIWFSRNNTGRVLLNVECSVAISHFANDSSLVLRVCIPNSIYAPLRFVCMCINVQVVFGWLAGWLLGWSIGRHLVGLLVWLSVCVCVCVCMFIGNLPAYCEYLICNWSRYMHNDKMFQSNNRANINSYAI